MNVINIVDFNIPLITIITIIAVYIAVIAWYK